jgi:hypothetical protein
MSTATFAVEQRPCAVKIVERGGKVIASEILSAHENADEAKAAAQKAAAAAQEQQDRLGNKVEIVAP